MDLSRISKNLTWNVYILTSCLPISPTFPGSPSFPDLPGNPTSPYVTIQNKHTYIYVLNILRAWNNSISKD